MAEAGLSILTKEGDLVVQPSPIAATAARRASVVELSTALAVIVTRPAVQHGKGGVEPAQDDLCAVFVLAVLVLPFAGFELACQQYLRAFLKVLLCDANQAFREDRNAVKLCPLSFFRPLLSSNFHW